MFLQLQLGLLLLLLLLRLSPFYTTTCKPAPRLKKLRTWWFCCSKVLLLHRSNLQETGDLEGVHIPPGWGGLTLVYSRLTSVSTQPGGRPKIVFSGDVSSTWQHSIRGMQLKKVLLLACPCWCQLQHLDYGKDARVLLKRFLPVLSLYHRFYQ